MKDLTQLELDKIFLWIVGIIVVIWFAVTYFKWWLKKQEYEILVGEEAFDFATTGCVLLFPAQKHESIVIKTEHNPLGRLITVRRIYWFDSIRLFGKHII